MYVYILSEIKLYYYIYIYRVYVDSHSLGQLALASKRTASGLNFKAFKTNWTIKGKPPFTSEATLMLNGTTLTKENTIKYLGAILGSDESATHVAHRIKAANGSFFKLHAADMHGGPLSPKAIRHIYIYIYTRYSTYFNIRSTRHPP